jgi:hypothetical protein
MLQIHCEKRDFGSNIGTPIPGAELDAVKEVDTATGGAHTCGVQIAMSIADSSVAPPALEELTMVFDERLHVPLDGAPCLAS